MTTEKLCRWGILGTAGIARKNWDSIRNAGNATLAAVASRSKARAQQFIDECQACAPHSPAPRACSYEELLPAADIDAVYIPLPTGDSQGMGDQRGRSGQARPVREALRSDAWLELEEMLAACRQNHVQFMDGVMFMHSGRLQLTAASAR